MTKRFVCSLFFVVFLVLAMTLAVVAQDKPAVSSTAPTATKPVPSLDLTAPEATDAELAALRFENARLRLLATPEYQQFMQAQAALEQLQLKIAAAHNSPGATIDFQSKKLVPKPAPPAPK